MTNGKLQVAVIGAGRISEQHLRYLTASDRAEVVAVCDLSPALADFAAQRFGVAGVYSDHRRMLEEQQPDVLHVLTPPHTHRELAGEGLELGAHVIVEKPITPTRAEFHELWSVAQQRDRYLVENHNYRFNEPFLAIERLVGTGRLGEIREVEVRMSLRVRDPGNRYADQNLPHSSHDLPAGVVDEFLTDLCYLALRFLPAGRSGSGQSLERICAAWSNHGGRELFKYDDLDAVLISGPAHARIRFSCHTWPECFTVTVHGTEGTAHTDLFQPHIQLAVPRRGPTQLVPVINQHLAGRELKRAARRNFVSKLRRKTPYEGLHTFLDRTYRALHDRTDPPVSYDDMDRTLQLSEALLDEANRI